MDIENLTEENARLKIVQHFCNQYKECVYLEIGVESGHLFFQINAYKKIAVDLDLSPIKIRREAMQFVTGDHQRGNARNAYFELTSNQFFKNEKYLGSIKINVVFIDGNHSYAQSKADAINSLDWVTKDGVVILHDTNPKSESAAMASTSFEAAKKMVPDLKFWNGEVWKTVLWLRKEPFVALETIDIEHGFTVCRIGNNEKRLKVSDEEIERMTYDDLARNRDAWLLLQKVS